ncbi:MAG: Fmu (Sun) domain-containing protein [Chitinophagaceae bacterium]
MTSFLDKHLLSAEALIKLYTGKEPFHLYLKKHFSANKKYGSKDRKNITHFCYCYFRMGGLAKTMPIADAIKTSIWLSSTQWNNYLQHWFPDKEAYATASITEKWAIAGLAESISNLWPFVAALSEQVNKQLLSLSHLQQPDLFIRCRKNKQTIVEKKLEQAGVTFEKVHTMGLRLLPNIPVDNCLAIDKEVVIQDLSSQKISDFFTLIHWQQPVISVWDSCAASGGKSILAADFLPKLQLAVSDIRASILQNLQKRLTTAGVNVHFCFTADLTKTATIPFEQSSVDLVICDVPCSGSGTWSRNPENLLFFDEANLQEYHEKQVAIAKNVWPYVKKGGYLLYSTCSVFAIENEAVVQAITAKFADAQLIKAALIEGYTLKADTLFGALLQKI